MTKILTAAGYMIQDLQGNAIFGVGATVDEAWAQVVDAVGTFHGPMGNEISADEAYQTQFKTFGATQALLDKVAAEGGNIAWGVIGGVGCTRDEAEEVDA